jgi:hypothetical protein
MPNVAGKRSSARAAAVVAVIVLPTLLIDRAETGRSAELRRSRPSCSGPCHMPQTSGKSLYSPARARSASERPYFLTCDRFAWPMSSASSIN